MPNLICNVFQNRPLFIFWIILPPLTDLIKFGMYPYLTIREDVLPPSAEASNGPNAHPRINRKVTKSPSAVLTWVHTNTWNHPLPREGLLTWTYLLICTLGIFKRISARKHISTSILVTITTKTSNQETRVPSPRTPCISSALLCNPGCLLRAHPVYYQHCFITQGAFTKHTLYNNSVTL